MNSHVSLFGVIALNVSLPQTEPSSVGVVPRLTGSGRTDVEAGGPRLRPSNDCALIHDRSWTIQERAVKAGYTVTTYGGDLVSTWSVLRQSCKPRSRRPR
jgi:hypothetical protein